MARPGTIPGMSAIEVTAADVFNSDAISAEGKTGIVISCIVANMGAATAINVGIAMVDPDDPDEPAGDFAVWESADITAEEHYVYALHPGVAGDDSSYTAQAAVVLPPSFRIVISADADDYEVSALRYALI